MTFLTEGGYPVESGRDISGNIGKLSESCRKSAGVKMTDKFWKNFWKKKLFRTKIQIFLKFLSDFFWISQWNFLLAVFLQSSFTVFLRVSCIQLEVGPRRGPRILVIFSYGKMDDDHSWLLFAKVHSKWHNTLVPFQPSLSVHPKLNWSSKWKSKSFPGKLCPGSRLWLTAMSGPLSIPRPAHGPPITTKY